MASHIKALDTINSRHQYKRKFSLQEMYWATVYAPKAMYKLIENKKKNLLDQSFIKRLQLAVTEVNGCAICSYGHAQMALRLGMGNEEISSFLGEDEVGNFIKPEEAKAIAFAQHFADSRAFPKKYAYNAIIKEYGEKQASIILSACQMMIVGNIYGIPLSAFISRIQGNSYKDSSLFYELITLFLEFIILPIGIIHGFLRSIFGFSNENFDLSINE